MSAAPTNPSVLKLPPLKTLRSRRTRPSLLPPRPETPPPPPLIRPRLPLPFTRFDPGWLFLAVGIATMAATVLIPAQRDLDMAYWQRDRALAIERHRMDRVARYGQYLAAVDRGDDSVVLSLVGTQLNKSPAAYVPLYDPSDPARTSASVFPNLEPPPMVEPPEPGKNKTPSRLERWTNDSHWRLWLLAGGVLCTLIGLLPAARSNRGTPAEA